MDNDAIDRGYEIAIGEAGGPQAQWSIMAVVSFVKKNLHSSMWKKNFHSSICALQALAAHMNFFHSWATCTQPYCQIGIHSHYQNGRNGCRMSCSMSWHCLGRMSLSSSMWHLS
jgi:hypothetical protein